MSGAVRVSVLIATCNRPRLLERSLAAVLAASPPPDELLVLDQSDDPSSRQVVERLAPGPVRLGYHHLDRRGKSRALNHALDIASGDFVALTDDDVTVDRGWIATFHALHAHQPQVDAFCGRVLPEPGTDPRDYLNLVLETEPRCLDRRTNPVHPSFCGANLFVRRQALRQVGGYDIHFGPGGIFKSNDDGELAYRLTRAGLVVRYAPELVVHHLGWRKERENLALLHDYAFSLGGFVGYYARQGRLGPLPYFAWTCLGRALALARAALAGDRTALAEGRVHIAGYASGFRLGLATPPGDPAP